MSGLTKGGSSALTGTPVDSGSAGGSSIDLATETTGVLQAEKLDSIIENMLTSGILEGGLLSINGGDPATFDLTAGDGIIVNSYTDPDATTINRVSWNAFTGVSVPLLGSAPIIRIAIDQNGNIFQQGSPFTALQRRTHIIIGALISFGGTQIESVVPAYVTAFERGADVVDFIYEFGAFNIDGNIFEPNGANLNIDKTSGQTWALGGHYDESRSQPSITNDDALTATTWRYTYQDGAGGFVVTGDTNTEVDPNQYDDGSGTLASVPVGDWTVQRIFWFGQAEEVALHYGQGTFVSQADAEAAITDVNVKLNPLVSFGVLRGWLIVKQGATDLSDPAQAKFIGAGRFGVTDITSGGGTGENNTASNVGAGGVGVFKQKAGVNLEFKNLNAGSSKITVTDDPANDEVDIDLGPHASTHQHGGSDEVATATPAANQIPKADGSGNLASGWGGAANSLATLDANNRIVEERLSQEVTAVDAPTTTSATFVLLPNMTITPEAGTYLVSFNGEITNGTNNSSIFVAVFVGGVEVTASSRESGVKNPGRFRAVSTQARVTVNGSQAIAIHWRTNNVGTNTAGNRSLSILKVAP